MQPGCQDVRPAARPAPVFFRPACPNGPHLFHWCELLSRFVPGISIAVVLNGLAPCLAVRSITLPAHVAPDPRPIFPINRSVLVIDNHLFLLLTFLALLLGDIWTWVTSLNTLFEFSSHSFDTCLPYFFHN